MSCLALFNEIELIISMGPKKFITKRIPWIGIIALILLYFGVKKIADSNISVVVVKMMEQPTHEHMAGLLSNTDHKPQSIKDLCKICKLHMNVKNIEKIPKTDKLIIIANHDNIFAGSFIASQVNPVRTAGTAKIVRNDYRSAFVEDEYIDNNSQVIKENLDNNNPVIIFPGVADLITGRKAILSKSKDDFLRLAIENQANIMPAHVRLEYPLWWRILWWIVPHKLGKAILQTFFYNIYKNTQIFITFGNVIPLDEIMIDKSSGSLIQDKMQYPDSVLEKYIQKINILMR